MKGLLDYLLRRTRSKIQRERLFWGSAILLFGLLIFSLGAAYFLSQVNFTPSAVLLARVSGLFLLLLLAGRFILLPLWKPPSWRTTARFLEERHPELQDRLSTAVEIETQPSEFAPELRLLVQRDAYRILKDRPLARLFWPQRSIPSILTSIVSVILALSLYFSGPVEYRYSLESILGAGRESAAAPLYQVLVSPGDAVVGEKADLEINATLVGYDSPDVRLFAKYENTPQWESSRMFSTPDSPGFTFKFFDIREPIDYYVEADGIRSPGFRIEVAERPRVIQLSVLLQFPAYTGLPNLMLENEDSIRALKGTVARLFITTDRPSTGGFLGFDEAEDIDLVALGENRFEASFELNEDDWLQVQMADREGTINPASDEYRVEVLKDQPPSIAFTLPGRDTGVSNIEEVFVEVKAEDDYGISELQLVYSVNGGPAQEVILPTSRGTKSVTVPHILYLEEMGLQPGDFIAYHAKAKDSVVSKSTDIFFLEVEPFEREYFQSQRAAGQSGGERGLELSKQQKQIIVASFSLVEESERYSEEEHKENSQTLALVQNRLQTQAQMIVDRISRRGAAASDPRLQKMAEHLRSAIEQMLPAEQFLNEVRPEEALPKEQQSLLHLLRSEALFTEIQVSFSENTGNSSASPEELADLVDLELDRTKNQYETLRQNQELRQDQALDDAMEKLKELARRQEQEVARRRRAQAGSSGGQVSEEQLVEEVEELARQLARLSRNEAQQQLSRISRELERAAREMRNSISSGQSRSQSLLQSQQAMERLKQAANALDQQRQSELRSQIEGLKNKSDELVSDQRQLARESQDLERQSESASSEANVDFLEKLRDLFWKKQELQQSLQELEGSLHQTARRMEPDEPRAAKKLKEAGLSIRDERLPEKMQEGSDLLANGLINMARRREEGLVDSLDQLSQRIGEAASLLGQREGQQRQERLQEALAEVGELAENLESLQQRPSASEGSQRDEPQEREPGSKGGSPSGSKQGGTRQAGRQQEAEGPIPEGEEALQPMPGPSSGGPIHPQAGVSRGGGPGGGQLQAQREWQERLNEASRLKELLEGEPGLGDEASRLFSQLQQINPGRLYSDAEELSLLKARVIDGLHQLELSLNRALQREEDHPLGLVNRDEIPAEFQEQVEEYFKRLSSRKK